MEPVFNRCFITLYCIDQYYLKQGFKFKCQLSVLCSAKGKSQHETTAAALLLLLGHVHVFRITLWFSLPHRRDSEHLHQLMCCISCKLTFASSCHLPPVSVQLNVTHCFAYYLDSCGLHGLTE